MMDKLNSHLRIFALQGLAAFEHRLLGGGQHSIETAQHSQRQHDPFVLRRPVRPAQQVSHRPDEIRQLLKIAWGYGCISLLSRFSLPCPAIRLQKASNCLLASLKGTVLLFSQRLIVEKLTNLADRKSVV